MSIKPLNLRTQGGKTSRQILWEAIRARKVFTLAQLHDDSDKEVRIPTALAYVQGLCAAGYVEQIDGGKEATGVWKSSTFQLKKDVGVDHPRITREGKSNTQGRGKENMWIAMKVLGDFTVHELVFNASTEQQSVKLTTANEYVANLVKAGYLRVTQRHGPGRPARYRLLASRNTGPQPPSVQRNKAIYDGNLDKVVWPPEGVRA